MWGLSPAAASGGHSSSRCAGLSLSWPLLLRSTGSRRAGSVVVAHGPSCSVACGILPDQGSNPCPLHWQADSQPLRHQGSPGIVIFVFCVSHSDRRVVLSRCCFNLHFLMTYDLEHLFMFLFAICIFPGEVPVQIFSPYISLGFFFFYCWVSRFLCIFCL